jgi:chorismate mutase
MARGAQVRGGRRGERSKPDPAADPPGGSDPLDDLRRSIDAIDRELVALLNRRAGHAIALGGIKRERGLPIYQPAREEEVLANVQGSNHGPLEDAALRRLFERIIDESRRIERVGTGPEGTDGSSE